MQVVAEKPLWKPILDAKTAAFLTQRHKLRLLEPFMGREASVGDAAAELGLDENFAFRTVKALEKMGLLEVARQETRRRRKVKLYRCTAEEFRVPMTALALETIFRGMDDAPRGLFERNLAALLAEQQERHPEWAVRVFRNPQGQVILNLSTAPGQAWTRERVDDPVMVGDWSRFDLSFEDAKALQRELQDIHRRYSGRGGPQTYLVGLFLAAQVVD